MKFYSAQLGAAVGLAASMTAAAPAPGQLDLGSSAGPAVSLFRSFLAPLESLVSPRLVQTAADAEPYWTTEAGKHWLLLRGIRFMDITDNQDLGLLAASRLSTTTASEPFPTETQFGKELKPVFANISEAGPRKNLEKFTSFRTRYYRSESGRDSQKWLLGTARAIASANHSIRVTEFPHSWGQNSIILHIPGRNASATAARGVTILGAHQDSTNFLPFLAAPGADDDGSGTVTILEALRALVTAGFQPESDVEWHWYSAEEGGLLGSQEVAAEYERQGTKVRAMLQQDMTAFVKRGTTEQVGVVADFVDADLAEFVKVLVKDYLDIPSVDTKIGYAASDHASWTKIGAPSAFAIEGTFENSNTGRIHTTSDRYDIDEFSFKHLLQFCRLSIAFAVELGGWAHKASSSSSS